MYYSPKTSTDGLVFHYDTGNTVRSFKGEPATNLITSGIPGYFGSGGQTLYQDSLYGLKSDSGIFQRNYVTNPALADSGTYNNNGGLYKNFTTSGLNAATRYIQISFDFYMITRYRTYAGSGTGLNGYIGITNTDSTTDAYGWNTTYSNGSGDDWSNDEAYVGQWQKVSLIAALRGDKDPASINAMYIYHDRFTQGEGIFTNFIITEHTTFPTGPIRYTSGTRSSTQGLLDLTGNSTIDVSNVSFDSNAQMTFDGTNDYVRSDASAVLNANTYLTLEAVIKPSSTYSGDIIILGRSAYYLTYQSNDSLSVYWYGKSPAGYHSTSAGTVQRNKYNHIVAVWNDANVKLYINGTLLNTVSSTGTGDSVFNDLWVGSEYDGGQRIFNGEIPVAKIYNRALTADEVSRNFNAIKSRFNIG